MPFNINEFHSNISKTGGIAPASHFEVDVPGVIGRENQTLLTGAEDMRFRIDSITVPSRSVLDTTYRDYGPIRRIGLQANYTEIGMSVILSPDLRERDYFLKWQDAIVGRHRDESLNAVERADAYTTGYYNDYISDGVKIKYYSDAKETPTYELRLIEAYPILVSDQGLSWDSTEAMKMTVRFTFKEFVDTYSSLGSNEANRSTSLLERLNQSGIGGAIGVGTGVLVGRTGPGPAAAIFGASSILGI